MRKSSKLVEITPYTERYIRELLPDKFKDIKSRHKERGTSSSVTEDLTDKMVSKLAEITPYKKSLIYESLKDTKYVKDYNLQNNIPHVESSTEDLTDKMVEAFPYTQYFLFSNLPFLILVFCVFCGFLMKKALKIMFISELCIVVMWCESMATPTTEQIREKALELWHLGLPISKINPTDEELRENGTWRKATIALMSSKPEKLPKSLMSSQSESEDRLSRISDLEDFPISQVMKEGCFVCGTRGSGKSNLAKQIVRRVLGCKIGVKVFDPSLSWKDFPLPRIKVKAIGSSLCKPDSIYDLSRLSVLEARNFVMAMMKEDLSRAIDLTDLNASVPMLYVLEEVQNLIPSNSLRTFKFLEISRFITQGRNFGLSFLGITQRLSSVDVNLVEISGLKFWLRQSGENNLRKARNYLDKCSVLLLRDLDTGTCFKQSGSEIDLVRLPLWNKPLTLKTEVSNYALKA